jgi:hypothetical protein
VSSENDLDRKMITEEHKKENLSRAHIQAVAARAGVNVSINDRSHDYGIDGEFYQISIVKGKRMESGIGLHFQLKSTTKFTKNDQYVHYEVNASTYNMLALRADKPRATPAILLVLCLPKNHDDQFNISEDELILRNCCYWHLIETNETENKNSVVIKIPRSRLFTPDALVALLKQIENGEKLGLGTEIL